MTHPRRCKMADVAPASSSPERGDRYCLVSCVPAQLRSADLRSYFSQFIEAGGFLCFHYRHRPEREEQQQLGGPSRPGGRTCCCLVTVKPGWSLRLVRMYSGKRWVDAQGETLPGRCVIRRVRISPDKGIKRDRRGCLSWALRQMPHQKRVSCRFSPLCV